MSLAHALHQLRHQLTQIAERNPGARQLQVSLTGAEPSLSWLAAQQCWPKFYWQARSGSLSVMALGAIAVCQSMAQATSLLRVVPENWRLLGANAVAGDSYLFLPILSMVRDEDGQRLCLNLFSDTSLYQQAQRLLGWLDDLRAPQPLPSLPLPLRVETRPEKASWYQQVNEALQAIARGEFDKVVLARASDFTFSQSFSAAALLAASQQINPRCYHFMLATTPEQALVGSSPERLYARHGCALASEALAGTADIAESTLLSDPKNQWENQLVVEDIRQRLEGEVTGLDVAPVELLSLRHLHHLRRRIHATLSHRNDARCVARLQPTAAVYGLPRAAAATFIKQHQPFDRGWYSGSIGYMSVEESEFAVVLRCAEVTGRQVRLYAGAGIVSGSHAGQEWQEVERKAATLGCLFHAENLA